MSFEYSSKDKTNMFEEKLGKDKIKELFNGVVIIRKIWWKRRYRKKHSKEEKSFEVRKAEIKNYWHNKSLLEDFNNIKKYYLVWPIIKL